MGNRMRAGETGRSHGRPCAPGFTLIELLVVLSIVALLLTLALPRYFQQIDNAKETVLIENLRVTREVIDKFYKDTGRYPERLDQLVERRYLKALPYDPITERFDSWVLLPPTESQDDVGVIGDIKSGAGGATRTGKPFASL